MTQELMNRVIRKPTLAADYRIPKKHCETKDSNGGNKSSNNNSMTTVSVEAQVHNKAKKKGDL